jgi:hypothetical protein
MTFDERVGALALFGFSERQTRFLVTVALHGGFCLRRQYMAFAGLKYGAGVRDFLDRLVAQKLATRFDFRRDRGHVYHLHASSIYDAIEQPDNRNRRSASTALIARKLMVLDYVLAHQDCNWVATEEDKVVVFTARFGVPLLDLPQRIYVAARRNTAPTTRYFIHKLPIFVNDDPPVVTFVWLVTDVTGDAFEQFVHDHCQLLSHLPHWRIVAVAPKHIPGLPACGAALDRIVAAVRHPRRADECDALRAYFTRLDQIERNDLSRITVEEIQAFQKTRQRFQANEFEVLFQRWKRHGDTVLADRGAAGFLAAIREGRGALVTHRLSLSYDRFGTRAGVS